MSNVVSTGLVFLFWIFLSIGAVKFLIRMIVPRRVRRSFSKLFNFGLNLACNQGEKYCKVAYSNFNKKLDEKKKSKEKSKDESISEDLEVEKVVSDNAVAESEVACGGNVIFHDFSKKKECAKSE